MRKVFFYIFRIKENAGNIFWRVVDWAIEEIGKNEEGNFFQKSHLESNTVASRKLWRLPGLCHAFYPGIREGFVILKTNTISFETDFQYFITNYPPNQWDAKSILKRILLHWDTETGVFGVKDNSFCEDKVRYKSINGAMSHVALLNVAWNCLSAPAFKTYWKNDPMSSRIQFWKDHPKYNPLR